MTTTPPNPYDVELALAAALADISQAQDTAIVQAWAKAWGSVSTELLDSLTEVLTDAGRMTFSAVVRYQRLNTVLGQVANHLDDLAQGLGITITSNLNDVVHSAEAGTRELIAAQRLLHDERRGLPVRRVPSPAMQAIVRRTTEQVTSQLQPLADETYATVLRELTKGVAAGDNPRTTARQMVSKAEDMHNFGRTRALNIARTETLDAYRAGGQAAEQQYPDLIAEWVWSAHLGPRTCRSCLSMHGRTFPLETPGPDDHPQGRCARIPVVREDDGSTDLSWLPDAGEHFAGLAEEDQRAILGNAGYDAWRRGDFPIDQWTKHQDNEGWRASQVPARPGDPTGGSVGGGDGGGKPPTGSDDEYPTPLGDGDPVPFKPSQRPSIYTDTRAQQHILDRHTGETGDGTKYPIEWQDEPQLIWDAIDAVLAQPASVKWSGQFLNFHGTVEDRRILVRLLRSHLERIETGHPIDGPGVTKNGVQVELPAGAYKGVIW